MTRIRFGWDNEFPSLSVEVPAFVIDVHDVTNAEYRAFVDGGGYGDAALWSPAAWRWRREAGRAHPLFWERLDGAWFWRGMFGRVPLPPAWPVYVTHDEASAFARWKGLRLPTEAEYHRAAFGDARRLGAGVSLGRRGAGRNARQLRFPALGSGAGRFVPGGRQRLGRARPRRQRLGMDVHPVRRLSRLRGHGLVSRVLRGLLRRRALRPSRGRRRPRRAASCAAASGTGSGRTIRTRTRRFGAPEIRGDGPGGGIGTAGDGAAGEPRRSACAGRRPGAHEPAEAPGREVPSTTRSVHTCSRPSANCPGYPITRGERALLTRERDAILARLDGSRHVDRARRRQRRRNSPSWPRGWSSRTVPRRFI